MAELCQNSVLIHLNILLLKILRSAGYCEEKLFVCSGKIAQIFPDETNGLLHGLETEELSL